MRLTDTLHKIKHYPDLPKDVFFILVLLLVAFGAFTLGELSRSESNRAGELRIIDTNTLPAAPAFTTRVDQGLSPNSLATPPQSGMYVGAKSGKTYYLPWCSGAKRIKEENKIWFVSKSDAEARGYKPSTACNGM